MVRRLSAEKCQEGSQRFSERACRFFFFFFSHPFVSATCGGKYKK